MDIALIPNYHKPDAVAAAEQLHVLLMRRQQGGGVGRLALLRTPDHAGIAQFKPELIIVLGGDGSILATAQALDGLTVPVVGINFGKLGYLAAFSLQDFLEHLDLILSGQAPRTERLMLQATVYPWQRQTVPEIVPLRMLLSLAPHAHGLALNDVVINAGEPFRMIELEVQVDQERTTTFRSDGLVVATASGSTGYNLSAGGPLISPEVEAMVLTPICPYSLAFRPVVLPAGSSILVCPHRLNAGSRVSFDGQTHVAIREDECMLIRRAKSPLTLVENPHITHWQMLAQKLHWARSPRH
jgi:NAD+ kinase